jgi:hypothetical protein
MEAILVPNRADHMATQHRSQSSRVYIILSCVPRERDKNQSSYLAIQSLDPSPSGLVTRAQRSQRVPH